MQSLGTRHPTCTAIPFVPTVGPDQTAAKALKGCAEHSQYLNLKTERCHYCSFWTPGCKGSAPFSGDSGLELNSHGSCTDTQLVAAPFASIPDTQAPVSIAICHHTYTVLSTEMELGT